MAAPRTPEGPPPGPPPPASICDQVHQTCGNDDLSESPDVLFSNCSFQWPTFALQADLVYLTRNPCFLVSENANGPMDIPVPDEVSIAVVRSLVHAHYRSKPIIRFGDDDDPRHWSSITRRFVAQYFGWIQPLHGVQGVWEFTTPLAPVQQHFQDLAENGMYADAQVAAEDNSWTLPVHRCILCGASVEEETVVGAFFKRWSSTASDAEPFATMRSPVNCKESVQLIIGLHFYRCNKDLPFDAEVIQGALSLAHIWDLKNLVELLESHIHGGIAQATKTHAEPDLYAFVIEMLRMPVQVDHPLSDDFKTKFETQLELAVVKVWHRLPPELKEVARETLPVPLREQLDAMNSFFQSTGQAFLNNDELIASWCEDLQSKASRSFEEWDSRWNTFAARLKPLGVVAMQQEDGSPAGLLYKPEVRPWSLPWHLEEEYLQLRQDYEAVQAKLSAVQHDWDRLRVLRQVKRSYSTDQSLETRVQTLKERWASERSKRPRMSRAVHLWEPVV
eukprot:gnl/MRDRNA2_/MRDRNA2_33707_c0_seq1.p1 gnl/MRDRNA2_/MRDRNA2_33707_c0~~gnl/MRDRNA2_/MRDRNA2_33707_c0_seq1.p1  ORF type:complete len:522 (+),score=86.43 gnl/MRDRNA2_/MRDRNA2_33707_c0_seq1:54-1568(+)